MSASCHLRATDFYWLSVVNLLVAAFISIGYLPSFPLGVEGKTYLGVLWIARFGMAFLLAAAALHWMAVRGGSRMGRTEVAILFLTLANTLLLVDVKVFQLYGYHINGYVLSVILWGREQAVEIDFVTFFKFAVLVVLLVAGQIMFLRALRGAYVRWPSLAHPHIHGTMGCVILLALVARAYCAYSGENGKLRYGRILPLSLPVGMRLAEKPPLADLWLDECEDLGDSGIAPATYTGARETKWTQMAPDCTGLNILIVVIESWRNDTFDPEVTPNLHRFGSRCSRFRTHYSGGHCTQFGLFSMMYGLHGTFRKTALDNKRGPFLIEHFKSAGYAFKVISSSRLSFPAIDRTVFVDVQGAIKDRLPGRTPAERDSRQEHELLEWMDTELHERRPFFAFLFLDSPHSPYHWPEESVRFGPVAPRVDYFTLARQRDRAPIMNRYRNAVHYTDHLVGRILKGLERRELMDTTVIAITGDHGEEFGECGRWGHSSAFSAQQTKVPLLLHVPGWEGRTIDTITSHVDIAPTILDLVRARKMEAGRWSGVNLLAPERRGYAVITGFRDLAVVTEREIVIVPTEPLELSGLEVRGMDYRLRGEGLESVGLGTRLLLKRALLETMVPVVEGQGGVFSAASSSSAITNSARRAVNMARRQD